MSLAPIGFLKVTELHEDMLTEVANRTTRIQATATSATDPAGCSEHADASATISVPLGRRAVPAATWTEHGTASVAEHGGTT
jgi:hypothetical protein